MCAHYVRVLMRDYKVSDLSNTYKEKGKKVGKI